ncbi:MAG: Rrf2 family transcriptional regulator [Spirochaetota bacterium]
MRITTKGRYALSAVVALACLASEDDPVSIRSLAQNEGIPADFLEQIFFRLRRSGIVSSVRGPGGGFRLTRPCQEISLLEILSAAGEGMELADPSQPREGGRPRTEATRTGRDMTRAASHGIGNRKAGAALRELEDELKRFTEGKSLADIIDA